MKIIDLFEDFYKDFIIASNSRKEKILRNLNNESYEQKKSQYKNWLTKIEEEVTDEFDEDSYLEENL